MGSVSGKGEDSRVYTVPHLEKMIFDEIVLESGLLEKVVLHAEERI